MILEKSPAPSGRTVEQSEPRSVNTLCLLLDYSRQSYYQGLKYIQRKAFESVIIIEEVLRYRKVQKRIGTRKLLDEMQGFYIFSLF